MFNNNLVPHFFKIHEKLTWIPFHQKIKVNDFLLFYIKNNPNESKKILVNQNDIQKYLIQFKNKHKIKFKIFEDSIFWLQERDKHE